MIYYIDINEIFFNKHSARFVFSKEDEFITCGKITTPIVDGNDSNFINTAKEKYGINFFLDEQDCPTEIYAIPYINIFASDKNGIYAVINDFPDTKSNKHICYINAESLTAYDLQCTLMEFINSINNGNFKKQLNNKVASEDLAVYRNISDAKKHTKISKITDFIKR
ncbi:hypothetical protein [uncultured Eubacterium sp.]|uniref:hypothetical protein n=1 Tax=uncultured Eubacterium sp. TaxID=165185 RepID=UPI0026369CC5|nr:hypothetical protein [uncultured Eubacterium sp.]